MEDINGTQSEDMVPVLQQPELADMTFAVEGSPSREAASAQSTNAFIAKIKGAAAKSNDREQEMKPHTAPTGEGGAAEALSFMEPKWDNLVDALEAAQDCQRCVATRFATKGCRACMGDFFEEIRLKASGRKRPRAGASAKD